MKKAYRIILFACTIVLFAACSIGGGKKTELTLGVCENGVYVNDYFGISIDVNENWYIMDDESKQDVLYASSDINANNSQTSSIKLSDAKLLPLLYVYEHETDYAMGYNTAVSIIAEKLSGLSQQEIKSEEDYYKLSIAEFEGIDNISGIPAKYEIGGLQTVKLENGTELSSFTSVCTLDDNLDVYTTVYFKIINKYILICSGSYMDENGKTMIDKMLLSLVIK